MRALVTGGAGFIGSHLVEKLRADSMQVRVLDNLSVGNQNVGLLKSVGAELVAGDIRDYGVVAKCLENVDVVFHLAAMNRAQRSIEDPLQANAVNIDGTLNLLEACRKNDVKRFIFASSSSVYGQGSNGREDDTCKPLHPYGVGKRAGEEYVRVYNSLYRLRTTVLRYVSVYGPRQRGDIEYAAVIPKFLKLALEKKPLTVYGDGTQTRHFTFVKDVVDGTVSAWKNTASIGEVFNLASLQPVSLNQIIDVIKKLVGNVEVNYLPPKSGEVKHNSINSSKAQAKLGFQPKYSIEKGLREILEYMKNATVK